jgi:hypothetical protein
LAEIDVELDEARSEFEQKKGEVAKNVTELRQYLWFDLVRLLGVDNASHFQVDHGHVYPMLKFLDEAIFKTLMTPDATVAVGRLDQRFQGNGRHVQFSEVLSSGSPSYLKRLSLLSNGVVVFNAAVSKLREERDLIQRMPLKGALTSNSFNEKLISHFSSIKAMSYLVRAGFFGNDYSTYIGYFYAGALGREDMNLILDLRAGESPAVISPVMNAKLVLSKLSHADLEGGRGILFGLIEYLCGSTQSPLIGTQKHSELEFILAGSIKYVDRVSEVLSAMLDSDSLPGFVQAIYHYQVGLYQAVLKDNERFSGSENRQKFILGVLSSLSDDEVDNVESDPECSFLPLVESLEDVGLLIPYLQGGEAGWKRFATHPVQFWNLAEGHTPEAIRALVELGFVKLNLQMLSLIQLTLLPEREVDSDICYQTLSQLSIPGLETLIKRDPIFFVQELLSQEGKLAESAESLTWLLNSLIGHADLMLELLERTDVTFDAIDALPEVLWPNILNSDFLLPSKDTVYTCLKYFYYFEDGEYVAAHPATDKAIRVQQTSAFLSFIARHADVLKSVLWTSADDFSRDLQKAVLSDDRFSDVSIRSILSETVLEDFSVLSEPIKTSRWAILVILEYLPYHRDLLAHITEKAPSCVAAYLTKRWGEAAKDFDPVTADMEVLIGVTRSEAVTIKEKVDLWKGIGGDIVKEHGGAKAEIARICEIGNRTNVIFPLPSCVHMLWFVSIDVSIPAKQRVEAFLQVVGAKELGWPHTAKFLENLEEDGFKSLAEKDRRFTVSNSDVNLRLISALRTKGFVGKATDKKDKIVVSVMTSALK